MTRDTTPAAAPARRARRDKGAGTCYYDAARECWVVAGSFGRKPDGSRDRRWFYGPTATAAKEKLKAARREAESARIAGSKQLTRDYLDWWLTARRTAGMEPNTDSVYAKAVARFLKPYLGAVPVCDLTSVHLVQLFAEMEKDGHSKAAQGTAHRVLSTALSYAVNSKPPMLPYNVCRGVRKPRSPRRDRTTWTAAEARRFLDATKGDWYQALYVLAANLGARKGELLGLHWTEVDLKAGIVRIEFNLVEVEGVILGRRGVKTPKSRRALPLEPGTIAALRRHRATLMAAGLAACPWVFPSRAGEPVFTSNLRREYNLAIAKAGVPRIRFHDLRHTHATLLIAAGKDAKEVSERLGHANVAFTLETYVHPKAEQHRKTSEDFARILDAAGEGGQ